MMDYEKQETVKVGEWTFSLGILEGANSMPEISALNARTGEAVRFKARQNVKHKEDIYGRRPPPMMLRDGTKLDVDTILDLLVQKFNQRNSSATPPTTGDLKEGVMDDFDACMRVVEFHFSHLLKSWPLRIGLLKLPTTLLETILASDRLVLGNEYQIFLLVKDWARIQLGEDLEAEHQKEEKGKEKEKEKEPEKKDGDAGGSTDTNSTEDKDQDKDDVTGKDEEDIKLFDKEATQEYKLKIGTAMEPLLKYVRFPHILIRVVKAIEEENFIPVPYITEAYRYQLYHGQDFFYVNVQDKRLRSRRYLFFKWDKNRKAPGLILSNDGYTVSASSGCSRQTILGNHGFSSGMNSWEVQLTHTAGCYAAIGVATREFKVESETLGIAENSWGFRLYSGSHCTTTDRRRENSALGQLKAGDIVRVELDMNQGKMAVYVNRKHQVTFKGLRKAGMLYPALSVCHNSPQEGYTLLKKSIIWDWDGSKAVQAEEEAKEKKVKKDTIESTAS